MKKPDVLIIGLWLAGVTVISLLFTFLVTDLRESREKYQERYELCIKADKQWLDGNCIKK
jgi:hypothetical protein